MGDSSDDDSNSDISVFQNARSAEPRLRYYYENFECKNITQKIINRQTSGTFSGKKEAKCEKIFEKIPPRLRFWLRDLVPDSFCRNHVLMGFSQCGQFLLAFSCHEKFSSLRRTFREGFSFKLHFLSWVPGRQVRLVHSVPLFDDDSVDNRVAVSIAQWKHNPSVLVAYGIAEVATERSYLSVLGVPKLGCGKCVALSNSTVDEDLSYGGKRCLEHNFAIHTKFYSAAESTLCEPVVQLAYENQIIVYTDFLHILEIDFVTSEQNENQSMDNKQVEEQIPQAASVTLSSPMPHIDECANVQLSSQAADTVVQRILADFSDLEMETCSMPRPVQLPDVMGQELCIQASTIFQNSAEDCSESNVPSPRTLISPPLRSPRRRPTEGMSQLTDLHRKIAEKTYEFVEETEPKCEKLSIYRKRRLADKKYEFSEDNSENIIPFRVLRSNRKYYIESSNQGQLKRPKSPPIESVILRVQNQIAPASPPASGDSKSDSLGLLDRDSASEVEYRVTQMQEDGSLKTIALHDNTSRTLSDGKVHPMDPYLVHSGNSKCSKYFIRHFVESDDDITSIITDSEDDCMYGYHVALPLTAHGAGYAPLQVVGLGAWERLRTAGNVPPNGLLKGISTPLPALRARQRSLDTEMLCNEVCVRLCLLNKKKFIYCFDWGCHVIDVCQSSGCLCGLCAMWLWASEEEVNNSAEVECQSCKESNAGCLAHRRQYAAECLFVWNLVTGEYHTERESFKEDPTQDSNRASGSERARERALTLAPMSNPFGYENRLLIHSIGRSLKRLTDHDHCIQITKKHPDNSDDSDSMNEDNEPDSDAISIMSVEDLHSPTNSQVDSLLT